MVEEAVKIATKNLEMAIPALAARDTNIALV
jgi:hypothetical protein